MRRKRLIDNKINSKKEESKNEKYWLDWFEDRNFTLLFLDGNHENFDRLYVMNFMRFIAQELREYMSLLGFRTIDEMVGHSEKLLLNKNYANKVDVSKLLFNSEVVNKEYAFKAYKPNFLENTIVQRIIKAHHGTITVQSEPSSDTRFIICLPFSSPA